MHHFPQEKELSLKNGSQMPESSFAKKQEREMKKERARKCPHEYKCQKKLTSSLLSMVFSKTLLFQFFGFGIFFIIRSEKVNVIIIFFFGGRGGSSFGGAVGFKGFLGTGETELIEIIT